MVSRRTADAIVGSSAELMEWACSAWTALGQASRLKSRNIRGRPGFAMTMPLRRFLIVLILCAALLVPSVSQGLSPPQPVSVRAKNHFDPRGGTWFEGAVTYLKIRDVRSGNLLLRKRFNSRGRARGSVPSGRARVISYQRPCSGNCGELDPPTNRCARTVDFEDDPTRLKIRSRADRDCRIRVRDS